MIKPKRKVSIFNMYKLQFYILGFLLSSMVVSYFFIIHIKNDLKLLCVHSSNF